MILGAVYLFARFIGFENIHDKVERLGAFGPALLITLKASTLVFAPLGGSPLYPISGALFGFWKGLLYMVSGDVLGAVISFYISRRLGKRIAEYFLSKPGMKVAESMLQYLGTFKGLAQARLFVLGFPEAVNYAAGLTKIPFVQFLTITIAIDSLRAVIGVALGDFLLGNTKTPAVFLVGVGMSMMTLVGGWWFYRQAKNAKNVGLV